MKEETVQIQVQQIYPFEDKNLAHARVEVRHCSANCKLTYINKINGVLGYIGYESHEKDKIKKAFDEVLKKCRILVYLNTASVPTRDWIVKNYEIYGESKIPVGYGQGYQYHIFIRNSIGIANFNMRPVEKAKASVKIDKALAKTQIVKLLRANKRKTDLVDKIIDLVEGNAEGQIN